MSDSRQVVIEESSRERSNPRWHLLLSDFANMVKAFIGSNYLTIAYAFTKSGLAAGIISLVIIAMLTDHCCHLIVKCKYHAIRRTLMRLRSASHQDVNGSDEETLLDKTDDERNKIRVQMVRSLNYGDVGKIACGRWGHFIVNACLLFTQFGFCVGYFIFLGNTIFHLFPYQNTTVTFAEESFTTQPSVITSSTKNTLFKDLQDRNFSSMNVANSTISIFNATSSHVGSEYSAVRLTTESISFTNMSNFISVSESPDLRLLVLTPLPIFIGFAFLRDIRHLGFVSIGANISIFVGCLVTLIMIFLGFSLSSTWEWISLAKLPVFFGMVTSSYEGIGTIIPIESSMEGNRHNFTRFLHGAISILTIVLGVFGIGGYLRYGDQTEQMLNKNISAGNEIDMAINIFLCIGVILTFPLQIYPVIELIEIFTFGHGRCCGPSKKKSDNEDSEDDGDGNESDQTALLSNKTQIDMPAPVALTVPDEVSTWKRNLMRIFLVAVAAGIAVLMRDLYAYVGAFVGAIGSSLLAYVLPCIFHLRLCWHELNIGVKIKDFTIVLFGIVLSILSLYTTIQDVVEKT